MYNIILVPLDGSKRAEAILPHVEDLAHNYNAKVILIQVVELYKAQAGSEFYNHDLFQEVCVLAVKEAESYLNGLKGEFKEKGIASSSCVVEGAVVEAIIDAAKREDADIIAIASHGRSGLSRAFYGSVAAGILHSADRPLLVIRSHG
jgi:nucleotide-binding universal stress UspA family protein